MAYPRTDWDAETIANFSASYMADETVAVIADRFGCTPSHVSRMARRLGLSRRRRLGGVQKWQIAEETRLAELVAEARSKNMSIAWVASQLGRKYAATHQRMQQLGLHLPRSGASDDIVRMVAALPLTRETAARMLGVSRTRIWELVGQRNRIARDDPDAIAEAKKLIGARFDPQH